MIKVTGNTMKSEIANAIQKYNNAPIYAYCNNLPPFTECYYVNKSDGSIKEFCNYVLEDLIEKTKDNPFPMIVIYTNELDSENIGILNDYAVSSYERGGYVGMVVLMTR